MRIPRLCPGLSRPSVRAEPPFTPHLTSACCRGWGDPGSSPHSESQTAPCGRVPSAGRCGGRSRSGLVRGARTEGPSADPGRAALNQVPDICLAWGRAGSGVRSSLVGRGGRCLVLGATMPTGSGRGAARSRNGERTRQCGRPRLQDFRMRFRTPDRRARVDLPGDNGHPLACPPTEGSHRQAGPSRYCFIS